MGMGGGKGDGGGGSQISVQPPPPSPYETAMANIAQGLYSQTNPLRTYFMEDFTKFLRPDLEMTTIS